MKTGIYMILNVSNNKCYIGSSKDVTRRKREHLGALSYNRHKNNYLQFSYNKYGKQMFVFTILELCSTEELITRENYWIELKNSNNSKKGYNLCIPKENGGYEITDLTREKLRRISIERIYGVMNDEEYTLHLLNKEIEKEEYKNRERVDTRKKILGFNKLTGELVKTFNSIAEISSSRKISSIINNQKFSYKGLVLIEESNYNPDIIYQQTKREKKDTSYKLIGRFKGNPVETFDLITKETIKPYPSTEELAIEFQTTKKYLYKVLCGEKKSFRGMGVRYI